jgi:hypothetical protein
MIIISSALNEITEYDLSNYIAFPGILSTILLTASMDFPFVKVRCPKGF